METIDLGLLQVRALFDIFKSLTTREAKVVLSEFLNLQINGRLGEHAR
jgi:hypothetical protein